MFMLSWAVQIKIWKKKNFVSFPQQLHALTQVLQLPIEVIQADASTIKIGEEFDSDPITLVYVVCMLLCLVGDFTGIIVQVYRAKLVEKCMCVYIYESETLHLDQTLGLDVWQLKAAVVKKPRL